MVARGGIEPPTRGFSGASEGNLSDPETTKRPDLTEIATAPRRLESPPVGSGRLHFGCRLTPTLQDLRELRINSQLCEPCRQRRAESQALSVRCHVYTNSKATDDIFLESRTPDTNKSWCHLTLRQR